MEITTEPASRRLSGNELVRLSQGFSSVFWGLPVALVFCVQLLLVDTMVADPVIRASLTRLYFSVVAIMLALICLGAYKLQSVKAIGLPWIRRARVSLGFALLDFYFCPFLYWWHKLPENEFYTLNLFGMIVSLIVFLISLTCLSMELGRFLADDSLQKESKVFLGLNALVLALPSSGAFTWAALRTLHEGSSRNLGVEFLNLFRWYYPWRLALFLVLFLPISLTLANLWRVKDILVEELKKLPAP